MPAHIPCNLPDPDDDAHWEHATHGITALLTNIRQNRQRAALGAAPDIPCRLTAEQAAGLAHVLTQASGALNTLPFFHPHGQISA